MTAPEMPQAPKLTSADEVERVRFNPCGVRKSGYVDSEVDAFLDKVGSTLAYYESTVEAMSKDIDTLEQEVERARSVPVDPTTVLIPAQKKGGATTAAAASKAVQDAMRAAEEITANARAAAERVVADSRGQAAALQRQIRELQAFEHGYRGRLVDYIESHLVELRASRPTESTAGRHATPKE